MATSFVKFCLLMFLAASLLQLVHSQTGSCESVTSDVLGGESGLISGFLTPGGEVGVQPSVTVLDMNIVCEAQAPQRDRYRFTSVVVSFSCLTSDPRVVQCQDNNTVTTWQFDLGCATTTWGGNSFGSESFVLTESPTATLSTDLNSQCAVCVNPDHNIVVAAMTPIADDTHCQGCVGCVGLGRCLSFNNNPSQCCNYYYNDVCVAECPGTLVPNNDFECVCATLDDPNGDFVLSNGVENGSMATLTCNEGFEGDSVVTCTGTGWESVPTCTPVQCPQLNSIENGEVTFSNNNVFGSMAMYTCNNGYVLEGDSTRTCMSDRTWSGSMPSCTPCGDKIPDCNRCRYVDQDQDTLTCDECALGLTYFPDTMECKEDVSPTPPPQTSSCDIGCIIGIILAILAVIIIMIVVIIVAFVLYKYLNDPATKLAKTDTEGLNGVARDNPLYVDPTIVTEEGLDGGMENGVSETTPLDASGDSA